MNLFQQRQQGFTLLEVLAVIGIIGILSSVLYWVSRPYLIRQQTAEATSQIAQSIERMRSTAAKTSRDARIIFDSSTPNTYELRYWGGESVVNRTVTIANGAQVYFRDGRSAIVYRPPYAEVAAVNNTIRVNPATVEASSDGKFTRNIFIVGVTGKVHQ